MVNGDECIGVVRVRDLRTVIQRDLPVVVAGHDHAVAASLQFAAQRLGGTQIGVLLFDAVRRQGTGVAAAVSAAKNGCSTLLIEKSNILGGLGTLGLVNLFVPMCNGRGKQIIFGLCEKWVRLSAKYGYDTIPEEWRDGEPKTYTEKRYTQRYSPYIFAIQLIGELEASGVDLLLDCMACDPIMEGKLCRGVITESKSGVECYTCGMLIDTTGDCDVLRRGGVPTVAGDNFFSYFGKMITLDTCQKAIDKGDIRLAFTGAIKDDILDIESIATALDSLRKRLLKRSSLTNSSFNILTATKRFSRLSTAS